MKNREPDFIVDFKQPGQSKARFEVYEGSGRHVVLLMGETGEKENELRYESASVGDPKVIAALLMNFLSRNDEVLEIVRHSLNASLAFELKQDGETH
jgi:hypothetical protein